MTNPVWIIDDDRSIRWVLEKALGRENIPVKSFATATEALRALADAQPPAALISDIRMPGTDGLDLLRQVKMEVMPARRGLFMLTLKISMIKSCARRSLRWP